MPSIDRFEINDLLGKGTQGKVYRCRDPRLQRDVAIKLLHRPLLKAAGGEELLHEARAMGRFVHPNVVSVFDVGEYQGKPFLVFELIEGRTLAKLLKQSPPDLPQTLDIMQGILDGMAQAHEHGIVHRDLKPPNIIITRTGMPKITDFGIAAMLGDGKLDAAHLVGTPRYMAPEYISRGRVSKQTDVFALGLIAYEMLAGRPAYEATDSRQLLDHIVNRPVTPLNKLVSGLDERLQQVIDKALARDPHLRFADAKEMLDAWVAFRRSTQTQGASEAGHSTVQFLLRRIRLKSDFPALSQSISTLNQLAEDEEQNSTELANVILKDQGLTNKILKVVNSAYYGAFSGQIGTVSRAIVILGVNGVRSIAASLALLDHFGDRPGMERLKELLSESLYSGLTAREIAQAADRELAEEALLGTMLRRLGHILVSFYLPDEEQEIERLVSAERMTHSQAQTQVLGTNYQHVGTAVAREWNFPVDIRQCMEPIDKLPKRNEADKLQRLQMVANFADSAVSLMRRPKSDDARAELKQLIDSYSEALNVDDKLIIRSLGGAKREYSEFRANFADSRHKKDFLDSLQDEHEPANRTADLKAPESDEPRVEVATDGVIGTHVSGALGREQMLSQGIQEVTQMMVSKYRCGELVSLVLETLYRGMRFSRIIACLRNPRTQRFEPVSWLGEDVEKLREGFKFRLSGQPNMVSLAVIRNADVYIQDATGDKVRGDLPKWMREITHPGSFFVLPMRAGDRTLGLLYAEYDLAFGFDGDTKVLHLMQALRNQLAIGLVQATKS